MLATAYLLPCPCGRKIAIEPRQAGETIGCVCGASITAPTMREIRALPPADRMEGENKGSAAWGVPQGLILLGSCILVLVAGWTAFMVLARPRPPVPFVTELRVADIEAASPGRTLQIFRQHLRPGLDPEKSGADRFYDRERIYFWSWAGITAVVGLIGAGLVVGGLRASRNPHQTG
jgi:hypothetical protein